MLQFKFFKGKIFFFIDIILFSFYFNFLLVVLNQNLNFNGSLLFDIIFLITVLL